MENNSPVEAFLEKLLVDYGPQTFIESLSLFNAPLVLTLEGVILAANDAFCRFLGYPREELVGKKATEVTAPEHRSGLLERFRRDIADYYFLDLVGKNGQRVHAGISPKIIYAGGKKYRFAEFFDHTEWRDLQDYRVSGLIGTAKALAQSIEYRDPYTKGHMLRTAKISEELAQLIGLDREATEAISLGASIHDIGKCAVPLEILIKPGKLDDHEWQLIKRHTLVGHEILRDVKYDKRVSDIVLLHHERMDGSGYPRGLGGADITLDVAIVAVADSLEAIAGVRPYRAPHSFREAMDILNREAHRYHREVMKAANELVASGQLDNREFMPKYQ